MNTDSELCTHNTDTLLEMTPMQQAMIDSIIKSVKNNNATSWRNEVDLYIKQIDDIDVNVALVLGGYYCEDRIKLNFAHLKIDSSKIQECNYDDIENKTLFCQSFSPLNHCQHDLKWQIANILLECVPIITTIKFNKMIGRFTTIPPQTFSFCEAYGISIISSGVVSVFEDCSVCYDKTKTLTPCNHVLCIPCWTKIKETPEEDEDEDEEYITRKCPVCRAIIY
jgi:hypothetical protein